MLIVSQMCKSLHNLYKTSLLFLLFFCAFLAQAKQPNIVLILTDDQSYGLLGATGNKLVQTPNIDTLAEQGVLFTNAHVSSAICTPSRISILLGQYEAKLVGIKQKIQLYVDRKIRF